MQWCCTAAMRTRRQEALHAESEAAAVREQNTQHLAHKLSTAAALHCTFWCTERPQARESRRVELTVVYTLLANAGVVAPVEVK